MPEIKNSFVKGRMNLDLDKRIIPNGEYTEAFNVQVSTSEDSDVGSVQNILGNERFTSYLEGLPNVPGGVNTDYSMVCIGSVSDEKKNRFYWFVVISNSNEDDMASAIIEHNVDTVTSTPIIIDGDNTRLQFSSDNYITGINIIDDFLFFTDGITEPKKINIEHFRLNGHVDIADAAGNILFSNFYVDGNNTGNRFIKEDITVIKRKPTKPPVLELETANVYDPESLNPDKTVTVEPFSFLGYSFDSTLSNPVIQFNLPNEVIVPANTTNNAISSYTTLSGYNYTWTLPAPSTGGGYAFDVVDATMGFPFSVGDIILMSDPNAPGSLPNNAQIKLEVVAISYDGGGPGNIAASNNNVLPNVYAEVEFEIISIDPNISGSQIAYDFVLENEQDILYETQFARFAYRYKYQDGEYSAFGPFTEVAFAAGDFNIHPTREPYNRAMENNITKIILKDFVTHDIPTEVVEIDLLYKKENSTTVYSLDTIKPIKPDGGLNPFWHTTNGYNNNIVLPSGAAVISSDKGYYEITKDLVYAAIPENQLLRPWDNVPKKAKAQDFTAGRLIYGNYTQNIDLEPVDYSTMKIGVEYRGFQSGEYNSFANGLKSIKSQRNYQTGVSFLDLYGRETPVFTSSESNSYNLKYNWQGGNQGNASRSNRLYVSNFPAIGNLTDTTPNFDPVYFKIFIKETSSEYYNLVLDRVYRAKEDGNLWLSFPSSDRNKLKEDDFIILKKPIDSDDQVEEENKFKVIDIQNEAPSFIRVKHKTLGILDGNGVLTGTNGLYPDNNNLPTANVSKFIINKELFEDEDVTDVKGLFDAGKTVVVSFQKATSGNVNLISRTYNIVSIDAVITSTDIYKIVLDRPIFDQDSWIQSSTGVLDVALKTRFSIEENKEFEEFQGRFFVKILSNLITAQYLENQIGVSNTQTQITSTTQLFSLINPNLFLAQGNVTQSSIPNTNARSETQTQWQTILDFDGNAQNNNNIKSGWFIDGAYMTAHQPTITSDISLWSGFTNPNNGGVAVTPGANGLKFDVSTSGNLTKSYYSTSILASQNFTGNGWVYSTYQNSNGVTAGTPDTSFGFMEGGWVNGLEGIIQANGQYNVTSTGGARAWKSQLGYFSTPGVGEDVYGAPGSTGFYMHLSFSGVGVDLHDGTGLNASPSVDVEDFYSSDAINCADGNEIDPDARLDLQAIDNFNTQANPKDKVCNLTQDSTTNVLATENQWNPAGDPGLNNFNQGNKDLINNLTPGSKFRFSNDLSETEFTILSVTKKRIYNHTAWNKNLKFLPQGGGFADPGVYEDTKTVHFAWHSFVNACINDPSSAAGKFTILSLALKKFGAADNRRVCYIIELDKNPDLLLNNPENLAGPLAGAGNLESTNIEFLEPYYENGVNPVSDNPAIFETEPKENLDLDIFYEASQAYPIQLDQASQPLTNNRKGYLIGSIGDKVRSTFNAANTVAYTLNQQPIFIDCEIKSWDGDIVELDSGLLTLTGVLASGVAAQTDVLADQTELYLYKKIEFHKKDGSYVQMRILEVMEITSNGFTNGNLTYDVVTKFRLDPNPVKIGLSYFNCFSFGNGVESNRIRDDFNQHFITNGVKASTTLQEQYKQDNRTSGLIFSGIYNKNTSLNDLNQFIMAEKITKELEPTYGTIQKLFARDSDLIALCQDKIVQIAADKDIIFNADGKPQLTASNKVLGQSRPFVGEYGISNNPESFASSSYRAYFTDKQRGAVLRLSMDGLTPISSAGMKDFFKDKFEGDYFNILGSYDSNKDNYNLTFDNGASENGAGGFEFNIDDQVITGVTGENADFKSIETDITVTYKESVRGWESFKGFIPEAGISCANNYFTIRNGQIYKHDDFTVFNGNVNRNFFYGNQQGSFVTTVFNNAPTTVKHFNTLNYDGEQGWRCDFIETDLNTGTTLHDFLNKENKWFSTIIDDGVDIGATVSGNSFSFQGIGVASNIDYNI